MIDELNAGVANRMDALVQGLAACLWRIAETARTDSGATKPSVLLFCTLRDVDDPCSGTVSFGN